MIEIFKFGGASVKDAAAIQNVANILKTFAQLNPVVVISAMGKTTNALEIVADSYFRNKTPAMREALNEVKYNHYTVVKQLFQNDLSVIEKLNELFEDLEEFLVYNKSSLYNYVYDQIVSYGELLSTMIVSEYLKEQNVNNTWLNAKNLIKTDNSYTEGKIDFDKTQKSVDELLRPLAGNTLVITQGFIGGTNEDFTTTLGREGSDYSASVLAYCLDAAKVSIWKDVPGVLNSDPKVFTDATLIPEMSFKEAVEMTYYGAQVIHPKTIKPLQNKGIPLFVRSFVKPELPGTRIGQYSHEIKLPPVIVYKPGQILLSFAAKDFSFVGEDSLTQIFNTFAQFNLHINMMQNRAISFYAVVDNKLGKVEDVIKSLENNFIIEKREGLTILTIRHYSEEKILELTKNEQIELIQKGTETAQILLKEKV